jgi:hypothetical protein
MVLHDEEQQSWWRRALTLVVSSSGLVNAVTFVSGVVVNVFSYFSNRAAATDPPYFGITPAHQGVIQGCLDKNLAGAGSSEAFRMLLQNGDHLSLETPMYCCVALSVWNITTAIYKRHKGAKETNLKAEIEEVLQSMDNSVHTTANSRFIENIMQRTQGDVTLVTQPLIQESLAQCKGIEKDRIAAARNTVLKRYKISSIRERIFNKRYAGAFFKAGIPWRSAVDASFLGALLWFYYGGQSVVARFVEAIPNIYAQLMDANPRMDPACANVTAYNMAGKDVLNTGECIALFLPLAATGIAVTGIGAYKVWQYLARIICGSDGTDEEALVSQVSARGGTLDIDDAIVTQLLTEYERRRSIDGTAVLVLPQPLTRDERDVLIDAWIPGKSQCGIESQQEEFADDIALYRPRASSV